MTNRDDKRQRKLQIEAAAVREAFLEGFQDSIEGRVVVFNGDLKSLISPRR